MTSFRHLGRLLFFSICIEVKGKQMDIISMTNGRGGGGCRGPRGMSFNGTYDRWDIINVTVLIRSITQTKQLCSTRS